MKVILTEEMAEFIGSFDRKVYSKVRRRLGILESYGHELRMPHSKFILPRIYELRTVGKDNIRLIYTFMHDTAVIFHGFIKKTEEIDGRELNAIKQKFQYLHL